jgi:membrane protein implicated in regulation of membrane protease activity
MFYVFLVCAVVGGTVFVCQFVMALVGLGADDLDLGHAGAHHLPHDSGELSHDASGHGDSHHGSTWLFGIISFRTIVSALTFFGLAGIASTQAYWPDSVSLVIAAASGLAAMLATHWMMRQLHQLRHDGSIRIERSVGKQGTVYIPIPPNRSGSGKVQLHLQGRIMEFAAMTSTSEKLNTGAKVVVIDVVGPSTVEVEPLLE